MRLTLVISSLRRGGAERVMSLLASWWAEEGNAVTLITLDSGNDSAYPIHPAVRRLGLSVDARSRNPMQGLFRNLERIAVLRKAIRQSQSDIIISFMDTVNVLTVLASRGLGKTVILSEHTDPSSYDIGCIWDGLRRLTYRSADITVCLTQSALASLQAKTKLKGCVIPNPVVMPAGSSRTIEGKTSGAAEHIVAAMGRLVPEKGFDLLLHAYSRIAHRHPGWSLVIMGQGPLKSELVLLAKTLKLEDRVRFTGEVIEPYLILRQADLFVLSSRFEGFPIALCEAMACGLPVVSFNCPSGPADIIRDGVDGILTPAQDVGALAAAMHRLMGDDKERARLAVKAPEVLMRFNRERILSMWQPLLQVH